MDTRIPAGPKVDLSLPVGPGPGGGRFLDSLSRGLAGASTAASAVGAVVPGAGLVGVALSGLSRLVGGDDAASRPDTARLLEDGRSFNLEYLQLQEQVQRESRLYTALSNIMRARHEAARNTLSNLR